MDSVKISELEQLATDARKQAKDLVKSPYGVTGTQAAYIRLAGVVAVKELFELEEILERLKS